MRGDGARHEDANGRHGARDVRLEKGIHDRAIQPQQQFRYTVGKNATDSALIIDAMDPLHSRAVGSFCIVSSDSVFTCPATRIREQYLLFVKGIGRPEKRKMFVRAYEVFVSPANIGWEGETQAAGEPVNDRVWIATVDKRINPVPNSQASFETLWRRIQREISVGDTIRNWTEHSGYIGDEFTIRAVDA